MTKISKKSTMDGDLVDMFFPKRIAAIIEKSGGIVEFSRKTGFSRTLIDKYKAGISDPSRERLIIMARVANVSLEWLATGYGSPIPRGIPSLQASDAKRIADGSIHKFTPEEQALIDAANGYGLETLSFIDIPASAGGGSIVMEGEKVEKLFSISRFWLHQNGFVPNHVFLMPTVGESMEPTINSGDVLLCSNADHHVKIGDGVYVVRLDGNILVKRLQLLPGKKIRVSSDNSAQFSPYEITLNDGTDFAIIGKVVFILCKRI